jgi:hypothetical protein
VLNYKIFIKYKYQNKSSLYLLARKENFIVTNQFWEVMLGQYDVVPMGSLKVHILPNSLQLLSHEPTLTYKLYY